MRIAEYNGYYVNEEDWAEIQKEDPTWIPKPEYPPPPVAPRIEDGKPKSIAEIIEERSMLDIKVNNPTKFLSLETYRKLNNWAKEKGKGKLVFRKCTFWAMLDFYRDGDDVAAMELADETLDCDHHVRCMANFELSGHVFFVKAKIHSSQQRWSEALEQCELGIQAGCSRCPSLKKVISRAQEVMLKLEMNNRKIEQK